jgi:hypothetical protein
VGLTFDDKALHLLERRHPGQGVVVKLVRLPGYGLLLDALSIGWCKREAMERAADVVALGTQRGVPLYADRRVAAYARWHAIPVTAWALAWWHGFAIVREIEVLYDLLRWERAHPGLHGLEAASGRDESGRYSTPGAR